MMTLNHELMSASIAVSIGYTLGFTDDAMFLGASATILLYLVGPWVIDLFKD